jgi:hypothetical protein
MSARRARWIPAALCGLAVAGGAALGACVLVEPPAELPPVLKHRPLILQQLVAPPATRILEYWPPSGLSFDIPVEMLDPDASFDFQAFLDYDPISDRVSSLVRFGTIEPDPATEVNGVRSLQVKLSVQNVDTTGCHVIEVIVANSFPENHTPDSYGSDSVTWFYAPTGSLNDCPSYDAGVTRDAGVEGGGS